MGVEYDRDPAFPGSGVERDELGATVNSRWVRGRPKGELVVAWLLMPVAIFMAGYPARAFAMACVETFERGEWGIALAAKLAAAFLFGSLALMAIEACVKLGLVLFAGKDFAVLVSRVTKVTTLVSLAALPLLFAISTIASGDLRESSLSVPLFLVTLGLILRFATPGRPESPSFSAFGSYQPNSVPFGSRALRISSSLALIAYGALGLAMNDLYLPSKRGGGTHLKGFAAVLMFGAIVAACVHLCAVVLDHYDRRDNEHRYRTLQKRATVAGWTLFAMAFLTDILEPLFR